MQYSGENPVIIVTTVHIIIAIMFVEVDVCGAQVNSVETVSLDTDQPLTSGIAVVTVVLMGLCCFLVSVS